MKASTLKTLLMAIISAGVVALLINNSINKKRAVILPPTEEASPQTALSTLSAPNSGIPPKASDDQIKVSAAGAYLMASNEPLYTFRSQKQWPIASVTKLMTAFLVRRLMTGTEIITMTEDAIAAPGEAGDFKPGERFTVDDLVQAMLVVSSNDAAKALAAHYGEAEFITAMNGTAADIGMTNTTFVDAAGLSPRNLSTPDDLSQLVRFIWNEDPGVFGITRSLKVNIVDINSGRGRKLNNINLFAGRSNFLGGKTGQLPDSDGNLVSIFSLPDKSSPVVIIVLGAGDRFKETEKVLIKL